MPGVFGHQVNQFLGQYLISAQAVEFCCLKAVVSRKMRDMCEKLHLFAYYDGVARLKSRP